MNKKETSEEKIISFLSKFPAANAEVISAGTEIFKLQVFKILKNLAENKVVKIDDSAKPVMYSLVNKTPQAKEGTIKSKKPAEEEKGEVEGMPSRYKTIGRDTSKFKFQGQLLGKGPLALSIVKHFVETKKPTIAKLKEVFKDELNPRFGVIQLQSAARKMSGGSRDRYFLKPDQLIKIGDAKVAVTNQWNSENIKGILEVAKKLGYKIT